MTLNMFSYYKFFIVKLDHHFSSSLGLFLQFVSSLLSLLSFPFNAILGVDYKASHPLKIKLYQNKVLNLDDF